uniref:SRCR domain-containing protein n=1 Tax=Chromera velia CCMP2878 TaxID=1169474 RepID=A0A0G4IBD3_9ALVE|eukprot:Cvel_12714.t1-p1 / transcript=Cvel_12714.t1 / gene=Cvel_12714 / organism=Chromera_velia_CCMP2878 / gene_product=hypothetical protein / transcript_product=hypothetical protein / location=Cvel_scaffold843:39988-42234(+) / protein_length=205 / sequence_SO=supercontig / SO=protein_coding / is_pseudo=false
MRCKERYTYSSLGLPVLFLSLLLPLLFTSCEGRRLEQLEREVQRHTLSQRETRSEPPEIDPMDMTQPPAKQGTRMSVKFDSRNQRSFCVGLPCLELAEGVDGLRGWECEAWGAVVKEGSKEAKMPLCRHGQNDAAAEKVDLEYGQPQEFAESSNKREFQWVCFGPACDTVRHVVQRGPLAPFDVELNDVKGAATMMAGEISSKSA